MKLIKDFISYFRYQRDSTYLLYLQYRWHTYTIKLVGDIDPCIRTRQELIKLKYELNRRNWDVGTIPS